MLDISFSKLLNYLRDRDIRVLPLEFRSADYIALDLSETNLELQSVDSSSSQRLSIFINAYLKQNKAKVAFGGYLEVRTLYKRSAYFNSENQNTARNIHLGVDLWCDAGTPILAALDGHIHSFQNNTNFGDYGPTIILKHEVSNVEFYTLYGHLSLESISNIKVGQGVKQGQEIACLGTSAVNGDYPPHLHFQIIKDIATYSGDYPGVCNVSDLAFYTANCPNPNLLLKI
ncbi:peptidase, M23 family [Formosa agariphila KMM 3901]|uniref:Peptidase, M23 family n=1 Tax=Formosa agariphila (strain DSM 15362 / KCTC 12365 / LMG 23005 / KMM 3901 / M-2Alg 35-1) TaxID=1347342 RepID=T2KND5_FORAG|nr:peptidoglycan DD-metalloendopeptidase family protein [Formosa agariphila]CDF80382.1 peptidase, M23 family [Formosa agariphila KMM 3901]